jgi:uncharacterized membrane protein
MIKVKDEEIKKVMTEMADIAVKASGISSARTILDVVDSIEIDDSGHVIFADTKDEANNIMSLFDITLKATGLGGFQVVTQLINQVVCQEILDELEKEKIDSQKAEAKATADEMINGG